MTVCCEKANRKENFFKVQISQSLFNGINIIKLSLRHAKYKEKNEITDRRGTQTAKGMRRNFIRFVFICDVM